MCEIGYDHERVDASREETRKARKEHRCDGCGTTIKPGDTYHYTSWIFEGAPVAAPAK